MVKYASMVHFAKSTSYKACCPAAAFISNKVDLLVVPVRVNRENGSSLNTWVLLDTGSEESFIT